MPRRLSVVLSVVGAVISVLASSCEVLPDAADLAESRPAAKVNPQPSPDIERELERRLSRAASGTSRAEFVRLFGPRARDLAVRWYRNMHMFGVSDVEAAVDLNVRHGENQNSRRPRRGVLVLGFHVPGVHRTLLDGEVLMLPATRYVVRVRRKTRGGVPRIMRWRPADGPAPWDARDLATHRARHVVLAAPIVARHLVRRYSHAADRATRYVRKTFAGLRVEGGPGFLVVVEPDEKRRKRYLANYAVRPPDLDPIGLAVWLNDLHRHNPAAGTLTLMQPLGSVERFEQVLVHEMVHSWMSTYESDAIKEQLNTVGAKLSVHMRAMSEGYAEWMSRRYADDRITELIDILRLGVQLGKIEAELPRNKDFHEGGETTAVAYLVSASVFTWIAQKYSPRTATRAAIAAWDSTSYDPFVELKQLKGLKPQRGRAQWNDWLQNL